MRRQPCPLLRRKVGPRKNTQPFHLRRGHRTDPVEAADRKRLDEGGALAGWDNRQTVRLVLVRRQLGAELVVGNARRCGTTGLPGDAAADPDRKSVVWGTRVTGSVR